MFLHLSFVTLIFALSALGAPMKRDVTRVENDIDNLDAEVNSLDGAIKALSDSDPTLAEAIAIHNGAMELGSAVQAATADLTASSTLNDSQATNMLGKTQKLVNDIVTALNDLDEKENSFNALHLTELVADDLTSLDKDTEAFGDEFMDKIPASKASTAQVQINAIDDAFEKAMKTYTS